MTGGCHYNFECNGFKKGCNFCPATKLLLNKLPSKNLLEKKKYFLNKKLIFLSTNESIYRDVFKSSIYNKKKT